MSSPSINLNLAKLAAVSAAPVAAPLATTPKAASIAQPALALTVAIPASPTIRAAIPVSSAPAASEVPTLPLAARVVEHLLFPQLSPTAAPRVEIPVAPAAPVAPTLVSLDSPRAEPSPEPVVAVATEVALAAAATLSPTAVFESVVQGEATRPSATESDVDDLGYPSWKALAHNFGKGLVCLGSIAILSAGGIEIAQASGFEGMAIALVAAAIGTTIILSVATLYVIVSKILNRNVAQLNADASANAGATPEAAGAARVEQVAQQVRNNPVQAELKDKADKVINQARQASRALKSSANNFNKELMVLNNEIKELRNKFVECAVAVGFSNALKIIEAALDADAINGAFVISKGADAAGVDLRDLILLGKVNYNVTGVANLRKLDEIKQGVLPGIKEDISALIANRFVKLVSTDADAAIAQLKKDCNIAKKIAKTDLEKSGVDLAHFRENAIKKIRETLSINSLVKGTVSKFIDERAVAMRAFDKADISDAEVIAAGKAENVQGKVENLADKLETALKLDEKTLTNFKGSVTEKFTAEVAKIKAAEAAARKLVVENRVRDELPGLEADCLTLQQQILDAYNRMLEAREGLLETEGWKPGISAAGLEAILQSEDLVVTVATEKGIKNSQAELEAEIAGLKARVIALDEQIQAKIAIMNEIGQSAHANGVEQPEHAVTFKTAYEAKKLEIRALVNEPRDVAVTPAVSVTTPVISTPPVIVAPTVVPQGRSRFMALPRAMMSVPSAVLSAPRTILGSMFSRRTVVAPVGAPVVIQAQRSAEPVAFTAPSTLGGRVLERSLEEDFISSADSTQANPASLFTELAID